MGLPMSLLGQTRRFRDVRDMSGLPQTADISGPGRHFAFVPIAAIGTVVKLKVGCGAPKRRNRALNISGHRGNAPMPLLLHFSWVIAVCYAFPLLAQQTQPGWIADPKSGCRMWIAGPASDDVVFWSGACANGVAEGRGVLLWFKGGKPNVLYEGELRSGKRNGRGDETTTEGYHYSGQWKDNKPDGLGTATMGDRTYGGTWTSGCLEKHEMGNSQIATWGTTVEECQAAKKSAAEAAQKAIMGAFSAAFLSGEKKFAEATEASLNLAQVDRLHVQAALTSLGYSTQGIDGIFGPRTRAMIASWQKARDYSATGFLNSVQLAALLKEAADAISKFDDEQRKANDDRKAASGSKR
jgi:hypothetical protein